MEHQELLVACGAIIGTLMSGLQLVGKWREEHREEAQTQKRFAQAQKRVNFLETWRNTQATVNSPSRQEKVDQYIADELDDIFIATMYPPVSTGGMTFSARRWMLMFLPRTVLGWLSRLGFFMVFPVFMLFMPFFIDEIIQTINYQEPGEPISLQQTPASSTTEDSEEVTLLPDKPIKDMTLSEYAAYNMKRSEQRGVPSNGVITLHDQTGQPIPLAQIEQEKPNLEGACGVMAFLGTICLICYLTSVRDGKYLEKQKEVVQRELPGFLIHTEKTVADEPIFEQDSNPYAA